jgi:hypothetical protein
VIDLPKEDAPVSETHKQKPRGVPASNAPTREPETSTNAENNKTVEARNGSDDRSLANVRLEKFRTTPQTPQQTQVQPQRQQQPNKALDGQEQKQEPEEVDGRLDSQEQKQEPEGGDGRLAVLGGGMRDTVDLVDRLRASGIEDLVPLPRIAVVGNQSAGKSSLIEAISGVCVL